jgi:hypothetical protein
VRIDVDRSREPMTAGEAVFAFASALLAAGIVECDDPGPLLDLVDEFIECQGLAFPQRQPREYLKSMCFAGEWIGVVEDLER